MHLVGAFRNYQQSGLYPKTCGLDVSILARPLSKADQRLLIKVLLGSKRQAHIFGGVIYILVSLVSKQFATFLHISLKSNVLGVKYRDPCTVINATSIITKGRSQEFATGWPMHTVRLISLFVIATAHT